MPKTVQKASGSNRSSYAKGYQLGNKGKASAGASTPSVKDDQAAALKSGVVPGTKSKGAKTAGEMNVSYGDTLPLGDLQTIADFGAGEPPKKNQMLKPAKTTSYAKEKGDSGSGFNLGKRR